jgi:hypothetical protein
MKNVLRILTILASPLLVSACTNTIDPLSDVVIADLTHAEATSWCATTFQSIYDERWKTTPPPDGPVAANGTVWNQDFDLPDPSGDNYGMAGFAGGECVLRLPIDQCADNLKLNPCQATLQQLDACLLAQFAHDAPVTLPEVCKTYRAMPSCDETVIGDMTEFVAGDPAPYETCTLPVRSSERGGDD